MNQVSLEQKRMDEERGDKSLLMRKAAGEREKNDIIQLTASAPANSLTSRV
jgi:hypothetical protein